MNYYNNQTGNNMTNQNQQDMIRNNGTNQTPNLPVPARTSRTITPQMTGTVTAPPGEQSPVTVESVLYTPGYLKTQIGRMVRVEFLIGTGGLNDRIGTLLGVGASYILIRPIGTDDVMLCDIYSIKFVTLYYRPLEVI